MEVDTVPQGLTADKSAVVVDEQRGNVGRNAQRGRMRRHEYVGRPPQRVVRGEWFRFEHVQNCRGQPPPGERFPESVVVDHRSPARIDHDRPRRKPGQERPVDQPPSRRGVWNDADDVVQIGGETGFVADVEKRVDVGTLPARARVALDRHPEVLRRSSQRGANRADAHEADCLAVQCAGWSRVPPALLLRLVFLDDAPLVREKITERVLGHQHAEHTACVRQDVIAPQQGIEQRLDARPRRLNPADRGQARQDSRNQRRLAEDEIAGPRTVGKRADVGG